MTIQSGATLRFTESDWFVPKEVVLSGVWKTGDQGRRTVTFCGTVDAPDDPAYLTLDAPCFNTVLTEFGAETGPRAVSFDLGVDVVVDQVSANAVSSLPALYQRFTGFWRVRAFLAVNGVRVTSPSEVPIAVTTTPIALSFQVDETYFANRDAVDAMFNLDPAVYEQWTPSLKSIAGVELVWGATDSVTGLTNVTGKVTKMGTYFLGQAFPALVVDNPTVAPIFKEKGVSSSVLHGLTIQPAEIAVDYPVAVTSATLGMKVRMSGFPKSRTTVCRLSRVITHSHYEILTLSFIYRKRFNPNTDVLNLPHCVLTGQDITEGCVLGPTDNVFAIYFPALGELTVRSVNDVPVTIARRQRRLLAGRNLLAVTEPTTEDFTDVLSGAEFSDPDVDPSGEAREAQVSVTDDSNQVASGPDVEIPTQPTNDLPNVFLQSCFVVTEGVAVVDDALNNVLPVTYYEKETTFLNTQTIVFDPDGTVLTKAEGTLFLFQTRN
tara:strand:+ start:553 stop:2028 length:1476 start_codon:yes stop_codon:yes gene_type:complete